MSVLIARRILESEAAAPKPGESHTLTFRTSAGASAASVRSVSIPVIIRSVEHAVSASGAAAQRIRALAISTDGAADPVTETIVEGEV